MDNQTVPQNTPQQGQTNVPLGSGMPAFNATGNIQQTTRLVPVASQSSNDAKRQTMWMVIAIVGGLVAVTFIALFIWMYVQWNTTKTDVDGQIGAAVATAVNEKAEEMENQFVEREKYPYNLFAGPVDYGELSFEYPKTWSVYEAEDAASGGDYTAYLNPDKVYPISSGTINALRVTIKNQSYDSFVKTYEGSVKSGKLSVTVRPINGENANVYTGELPGTDKLQGMVAVFKVRDKTAVIQTDAMIFRDDYIKILDSVKFNR